MRALEHGCSRCRNAAAAPPYRTKISVGITVEMKLSRLDLEGSCLKHIKQMHCKADSVLAVALSRQGKTAIIIDAKEKSYTAVTGCAV